MNFKDKGVKRMTHWPVVRLIKSIKIVTVWPPAPFHQERFITVFYFVRMHTPGTLFKTYKVILKQDMLVTDVHNPNTPLGISRVLHWWGPAVSAHYPNLVSRERLHPKEIVSQIIGHLSVMFNVSRFIQWLFIDLNQLMDILLYPCSDIKLLS